jgi:hypothetical protein
MGFRKALTIHNHDSQQMKKFTGKTTYSLPVSFFKVFEITGTSGFIDSQIFQRTRINSSLKVGK